MSDVDCADTAHLATRYLSSNNFFRTYSVKIINILYNDNWNHTMFAETIRINDKYNKKPKMLRNLTGKSRIGDLTDLDFLICDLWHVLIEINQQQ